MEAKRIVQALQQALIEEMSKDKYKAGGRIWKQKELCWHCDRL